MPQKHVTIQFFTAEYMSAPLCLKIIEERQGHISPKNQKKTMI